MSPISSSNSLAVVHVKLKLKLGIIIIKSTINIENNAKYIDVMTSTNNCSMCVEKAG